MPFASQFFFKQAFHPVAGFLGNAGPDNIGNKAFQDISLRFQAVLVFLKSHPGRGGKQGEPFGAFQQGSDCPPYGKGFSAIQGNISVIHRTVEQAESATGNSPGRNLLQHGKGQCLHRFFRGCVAVSHLCKQVVCRQGQRAKIQTTIKHTIKRITMILPASRRHSHYHCSRRLQSDGQTIRIQGHHQS